MSDHDAPAAPVAPPPSQRDPASFRLGVGDVINSTFTIWFGNFLPFTALALLIYLPFLLVGYRFYEGNPGQVRIAQFQSISFLADHVFFTHLLSGTVTFGVVMQLRRMRATVGRCLSVGLSRLVHVLAVSALVGILTGVWLSGFIVAQFHPGEGLLLLLLGIVPFLIAFTMLYTAVPVIVVERIGIFRALGRSFELTKGSRLRIFLVLLLFLLLMLLMMLPVIFLAGITLVGASEAARYAAMWVGTTVLAPVGAIVPAVIYHDLRVGKEGANVTDLAAVFE